MMSGLSCKGESVPEKTSWLNKGLINEKYGQYDLKNVCCFEITAGIM